MKITRYRIAFLTFLGISLLSAPGLLRANDIKWLKSIGGPLGDYLSSVAVDKAGNFYITGSFSGTVDFDPGPGVREVVSKGATDIFLAKYDAQGNYRWAFGIGAANADGGVTVAVDDFGKVLLTGDFRGVNVDFDPDPAVTNNLSTNNALSTNVFLAQYDTAGKYVWAKSLRGNAAQTNLRARGLAVDDLGNVYITGQFHSTVEFNPGGTSVSLASNGNATDIYMAKYGTAGDCIWARKFGNTGADIGFAITTDARKNVYIAGAYSNTVSFDNNTSPVAPALQSNGGNDIFFAKYDANGYHLWSRGMGSANSDIPYDITVDASENVYVTGGFNGDVDFDPGPAQVFRLSMGSEACFLAKYNSDGQYIWVNTMPTMESSRGYRVILDKADHVIVGGYHVDKTSFTYGPPDTVYNTPYGMQDYFVARYKTADGAFTDLMTPGGATGTPGSSVTGLASDPAGDLFIAGSVDGTLDFDPGAALLENDHKGGSDLFILKVHPECRTRSSFDQSACDSFVYNGKAYKSSGTYTDTFVNAAHCDSIVTFKLNITSGFYFPVDTGHYCDSVTFHGITYRSSGQYTQRFTSVSGCDSIYRYDITVGKTSSGTFVTQSACDSFVLNDSTVYRTSDIYLVTYKNHTGCDSVVVLDLTISATPATPVAVNLDGVLSTGNADSWTWINCDSRTAIAGAIQQHYTPAASGNYAVIITTGGCSSDTSDCVAVNLAAGGVKGPGDGHRIAVFPNPAGNDAFIMSEQRLENATIRIMNISGQLLQQQNGLSGTLLKLDMTTFAPGIYFAEIQDKSRLVRLKLVKE